jgi:hypothetical protein
VHVQDVGVDRITVENEVRGRTCGPSTSTIITTITTITTITSTNPPKCVAGEPHWRPRHGVVHMRRHRPGRHLIPQQVRTLYHQSHKVGREGFSLVKAPHDARDIRGQPDRDGDEAAADSIPESIQGNYVWHPCLLANACGCQNGTFLHKGGELGGEVTQTLALGVTESAGPDKQVRLVAE